MKNTQNQVKNQIEIVLSMTGNYFPYAAPLINSIVKQTSSKIRFHILYAYNVSWRTKRNIRRFQEWCDVLNASILFYDVEDLMSRFEGLPLGKWSTWKKTYYSHYIHLTAPLVLPSEVSRYIYLDIDMVCNADISRLWSTDIEGSALAVAQPSGVEPCKEDFNSGMLFVNLEMWRNEDILCQLIDYGIETKEQKHFGSDQRVLNLFFTYKHPSLLKYVDTRWNKYNNINEIVDAYIVHFIIGMEPKPWLTRDEEESMHLLWWEHAEETPFYRDIKKALFSNNKTVWPSWLVRMVALFIRDRKSRERFTQKRLRERVRIAFYKDLLPDQDKGNVSTRNFSDEIEGLCKNDCFNILLIRHLGDIFYCLLLRKEFERHYKAPVHFIIEPRYEFLMQLCDCSNYSVYPIGRWIRGMGGVNQIGNISEIRNWITAQPKLGRPIILEKRFLEGTHLVTFLRRFKQYHCFRWRYEMGLPYAFLYSLPKGKIPMSERAMEELRKIAPLDKIILLAPDTVTMKGFPVAFWNILADFFHSHGYTLIVNSSKYKIHHGITTHSLGLNFRNIVALGLSCAYVFSVRSGLCDVLVGIGKRLYAFIPANGIFSFGELRHPFAEDTNVNEILVSEWDIDGFEWEGEQVSDSLREYIRTCQKKTKELRRKAKKRDGIMAEKLRDWASNYEKCMGEGRKDVCNPMIPMRRPKFSFMYRRITEIMPNQRSRTVRTFLGGAFTKVINEFGYKELYLFGVRLNKCRFYKNQLSILCSQIPPQHDDIYIFRHHIGETYMELSHLKARIERNGSACPLVLIQKPRMVSLYRMFLPEGVALKSIEVEERFLHEFFNDKPIKVGHQRIYCCAPFIVEKMREKERKGEENVNLYTHMLSCMGLTRDATMTSPIIHDYTRNYVDEYCKKINLNKKFIILITQAASLNKLPDRIWENIAVKLMAKGYDVIVNEPTIKIQGAKYIDLDLGELYVLSMSAFGIVSIANGLAVLLSSTGKPMDILYTSHHRWFNYKAKDVMRHYSLSHLPNVNREIIYEYNMDLEDEDKVISCIIKKF